MRSFGESDLSWSLRGSRERAVECHVGRSQLVQRFRFGKHRFTVGRGENFHLAARIRYIDITKVIEAPNIFIIVGLLYRSEMDRTLLGSRFCVYRADRVDFS